MTILGSKPHGCERCDRCRPLDARELCSSCADVVDRREAAGRRAGERERQAQRELGTEREAAAVTAQEIRTDGGEQLNEVDTREQIHTGVSITAKLKRGTGTRDQDEINIKAKGRDAEHAAAELEQVLERADDWSEQLRAIQPDNQEVSD